MKNYLLISLLTVAALMGCATTSPAQAHNELLPGESLPSGHFLTSTDGRFRLTMQRDSNVVLYQMGQALWASGTMNQDAVVVTMQGDGNLVVYNDRHNPLWASGTQGYPGAYAKLQNDGNFVIYQHGRAIWATSTCCH